MSWPLDGEQDLELGDIQGHVLVGFGGAPQALGAYTARDPAAAARTVGRWAGRVTTAEALYATRKGRRARDVVEGSGPWVAIAVSHRVLRAAGRPADFDDDWFERSSMAAVTRLNDPWPADGAPLGSDWVVGGPSRPVDVLVVVAAGKPVTAEELVSWFTADARVWMDGEPFVERLLPMKGAKEHFGFRDGISQPGVRGRLPWGVDEFLTPRRLAPEDPEASEFAKPGQPLVRVGQFLFGYAAQNRHVPTDAARPRDAPAWAANGSFLVFRRLEQDVAAFRAFVAAKAAELGGVSEERFAALLVGRWPSGAPLMRAPTADDPALAADELAANAFQFAEGSRGGDDPFPPAPADLDGARCPIWAHVRKVNPRDVTTEQGSDTDTLSRRILRRGIPYGDPFDRPGPRGLLFISYQTSITDQFEFLASSWMNATDKPQSGAADGHDILVGQNPARDAQRVCTAVLRTEDGPLRSFTTSGAPWVFATGGGYFFAPSLPALTGVIAA